MANQELEQALSDVWKSLDNVSKRFENHLYKLEQSDSDSTLIKTAGDAVRSLKDSAAMYLTWAYHYAGIPLPGEGTASEGEPGAPPNRTF